MECHIKCILIYIRQNIGKANIFFDINNLVASGPF